MGNVWYYSCENCYEDSPNLTILSFVLIVLGYVYFCIPCVLCCCICMCLPVLIIMMIYAQPRGQNPASEEVISRLESVPYKSSEGGNKECVICFAQFEEDEEIIQLSCDVRHSFHPNCLKRWLRINSTCPICRKTIT